MCLDAEAIFSELNETTTPVESKHFNMHHILHVELPERLTQGKEKVFTGSVLPVEVFCSSYFQNVMQ